MNFILTLLAHFGVCPPFFVSLPVKACYNQ